jgi:iron complex outermembrane receptor protein
VRLRAACRAAAAADRAACHHLIEALRSDQTGEIMITIVRSRTLVRLACVAIAATPFSALAQPGGAPPPEDPEIIVTADRQSLGNPLATDEGVDADRLAETMAVINAEDSLRYLPSVLVRKRHIGDTQAPLATRTSGVGSSARSLVYADGVLLSALIGNNNSTASPRWGMVSPEEIERVGILYGPFSAAYPGNSIGAVVNLSTRLPAEPEGSLKAGVSLQRFDQFGTSGIFPAWQFEATAGDRSGPLSWFVSGNHVDSQSQPLAYVTVARPQTGGTTGTAVTGAFPGRSRLGAPIFVIGAGGSEAQRQGNVKLKLGLDLNPGLRLVYRGGLFVNDTSASAQTYLSGGGSAVYSGLLNIEGRPVSVPASAFANNIYRLDERHWMHALSVEGRIGDRIEWRAIASLYDFDKSAQRTPSSALPAALTGGAGSILRLNGTGWRTLDLTGRWRVPGGRHEISAGAHHDRFELVSNRYATDDWLDGREGALLQAAEGRTRTHALWLQDQMNLGTGIGLIVGVRYEAWRAYEGFNFSLTPALSVQQPERSAKAFSPKASLGWSSDDDWSITLSAGQAYRFPTVSELYQAVSTGPSISVPDPNLKAERARSQELAVEWTPEKSRVRISLFNERIRNALISQSAPLVPGSSTLFSYVQNIPEVRTRGLEIVVEREDLLVSGLQLSGSATLVDPLIVSDPIFPAAEGKDIPQVPRRRATLVLTYRPEEHTALTIAGRYSSRSFGTIDNSDIVTHTFQGFESFLVVDARASFRVSRRWQIAVGSENIGNARYFLFHPFPQRTFTMEVKRTW